MEKLLLLNEDGFKVIEINADNLDDFYKALECECFDIARRQIGGTYYDIFCDDMGLFKEDNIVTAINKNGDVMLVGNLIFANHDQAGNTTSLSDEDIENIKDSSMIVFSIKSGKMNQVAVCEY